MIGHMVPLPDLVVPNSGTDSNIILASVDFRDAVSITIMAPATLPELTKVQVSDTESSQAWVDLQRGGADVTIAAGEAETIELVSWRSMRLVAATVAEERTFKATKQI